MERRAISKIGRPASAAWKSLRPNLRVLRKGGIMLLGMTAFTTLSRRLEFGRNLVGFIVRVRPAHREKA